ncbi:hypothetical protein F5Y18DRAFT_424436 [Xylariaceae sp. FL1019]|nr:hypothetical protein F5Y18DRAFT_424436 [Xylariaceae sp. FL1019]
MPRPSRKSILLVGYYIYLPLNFGFFAFLTYLVYSNTQISQTIRGSAIGIQRIQGFVIYELVAATINLLVGYVNLLLDLIAGLGLKTIPHPFFIVLHIIDAALLLYFVWAFHELEQRLPTGHAQSVIHVVFVVEVATASVVGLFVAIVFIMLCSVVVHDELEQRRRLASNTVRHPRSSSIENTTQSDINLETLPNQTGRSGVIRH